MTFLQINGDQIVEISKGQDCFYCRNFSREQYIRLLTALIDRPSFVYTDDNGYSRFRYNGEQVHKWVVGLDTGQSSVKGQDIHHRNGNKQDNDPKNLVRMDHDTHFSIPKDWDNKRNNREWPPY